MKLDRRIALWLVLLAPPSVVVTFEPRGRPFQKSSWRNQHKFQRQRQQHQLQQQQQQHQRAAASSSSFLLRAVEDSVIDDDDADAAGGGGGLTGSAGLPLFIGPVAALAAGRQALQNRQVVKAELKDTEAQLEKVKQSLLSSDRLITVSFSLAALTSIASLGLIFATPPPAVDPSSTVAASSSSTAVSSSAAPAVEAVAPKIEPLVSIPDVKPTPPLEKSSSAFRFMPPAAKVAEPSAEPEAITAPEPPQEASVYSSLMDRLFTEKKEEPVDLTATPKAAEVTREEATKEVEDVVATEPEKQAGTSLIEFLTKKPESEKPTTDAVPAPVMPEEAKAPVVVTEEKPAPPEAKVPEIKAEEKSAPLPADEKNVEEGKGTSLLEFLTKKAEVEERAMPVEEKEEKKSILDSLRNKIEKPAAPAEEVEEKNGMRKVDEAPAVEEEKKSIFTSLMDKIPFASEVEEKEEPKSVFGSFTEKLELPAELGADPIVVGAVGVAALGVFAALLAANDDLDQGGGGKAAGSGSYLDSLNSNKYGSISGSGPQSTGSSYLSKLSGKAGPASYTDKLSGGRPARVKPSSIKRTVRTSGMVGSSTGYMDSLASGRVAPMKSSERPRPPIPPQKPPQKPTMEKKSDALPKEEQEEAMEEEVIAVVDAPEPEVVEEETPVLVEAKFMPAGSGSYLDRLNVPAAGTVVTVKSYGPSKWSPSKSSTGPVQSYGPSKWSPSKSSTATATSSGSRSYLDNIGGPSQDGDASSSRTTSAAEELPSINELAEQRGKEEPSIR